ncbi:type VI secretion system lipoprotein TssJ [Thalassomonas viridans]|uniref:Type VI secretion system lipoprotein TssJ n=1 Tax=Thalassomonas viridans TaxID=137584 RepID=A0AAF0C777_9GAMM|nr:type VI secretion system lipoprotein TssJ [Thalassomonas viridans]WDE02880.1 type VI secretion system lipoprotein TssJ [Thalassomonas viridans]
MMARSPTRFFLTVLFGLFITACASRVDKEVGFVYEIQAVKNINPNFSGDPSPVLLRVFQLTNDVNFAKSGFTDLLATDLVGLGNELIKSNDYLVQPGSTESIKIDIAKETKYFGLVSGFMDIENASWRQLVAVPQKGKFSFGRSKLLIKVNKLSISARIPE